MSQSKNKSEDLYEDDVNVEDIKEKEDVVEETQEKTTKPEVSNRKKKKNEVKVDDKKPDIRVSTRRKKKPIDKNIYRRIKVVNNIINL